ncbi:MAG TPA: DUF3341 domain-containing protein [Fimbriimonadaceae bacterium]
MDAVAEKTYYGLVAEYESAEDLVRAANAVYDEGFRDIDAFAPFPVHGLPEALGFEDSRLPWMIFVGGCTGGLGGFALQWWVSAGAYAHNVGGRPLFSWPAFIPITFECTVLFSALTAVFGMFALNKLPMPHHPVFETPNFNRASQDAFFLAVESRDPLYDPEAVRTLLEKTSAVNISLVGQEEEADW